MFREKMTEWDVMEVSTMYGYPAYEVYRYRGPSDIKTKEVHGLYMSKMDALWVLQGLSIEGGTK